MITIQGYEIYSEPKSDTDVYMCGKNSDLSSLSGEWIPRFKYEERERWFPYSPYEKPKLVPGIRKFILHPPVYFDIDGNRLPGNRKNPPKLLYKTSKDLKRFNFFSGGTFAEIICPLVIIFSIISTFIFNRGAVIWLFTIPGLLISYYYGKKAICRYMDTSLYDNNMVDMGCYGDDLEIPYNKEG